jgi:hypothetical protein
MKVNFLTRPFSPGDVKYSLLARKVTFRGTTSGMKIESLKERWLDAIITGPFEGTFRRPLTFGRNSRVRIGIKKDLSRPYATLSPLIIDLRDATPLI